MFYIRLIALSLLGITTTMIFQNCAPVHFDGQSSQVIERLGLLCEPHSFRTCDVTNGTGRQQCSDDGLSYGTCEVVTCNHGYGLDGNSCSPSSCENGANNPRDCNQCPAPQIMHNNICRTPACNTNEVRSCIIANGLGQQTCNPDRMDFGPCELVSCHEGYSPQNGQCVVVTPPPPPPTPTPNPPTPGCSNGATNYPACNDCPPGNYYNGTQCTPQVCTPNTSQTCSITDSQGQIIGLGQQNCASNGSSWGNCQAISCHTGYVPSSGTCVPGTCTNGANNYPNCNQCPTGQNYNGTNCENQSGFNWDDCDSLPVTWHTMCPYKVETWKGLSEE